MAVGTGFIQHWNYSRWNRITFQVCTSEEKATGITCWTPVQGERLHIRCYLEWRETNLSLFPPQMSSTPSLEVIRWTKAFFWWLRIQPDDHWIREWGFQRVSDVTWLSQLGPQPLLFAAAFAFSSGSTCHCISSGDTEFTFLTMMSLILHLFSPSFLWRTSPPSLPTHYSLSSVLWLPGSAVHSTVNYFDIHLQRQAIWFVTYLVPEWMKTARHSIYILSGKEIIST